VGAGTGVAFYPPFQLMWLVTEPELLRAWLEMAKAPALHLTRQLVAEGCRIIAMGGDVSSDKGPFLSPRHYREFILPVIQEHIDLIHREGALAVYTSDGTLWPIQQEFFYDSHTDGYMEVDKAAGMTFERLIAAGIAERVCILGNIDARHTLCLGTPAQVRAEVLQCLALGQASPGGHVLHASHSVHEDVKAENYFAVVAAYREYFGLASLPR
jgi:uroporphyrinogen decarboxylase